MRTSAKDLAYGRWPGILKELGIPQQHLVNRHGPCPICGGKDRFRFDNKKGGGEYFCSGCGAGDGFSLLTKYFGWDFAQAAKEVEQVVGYVEETKQPVRKDPRPALMRVSKELEELTDINPVMKYLRSRGLGHYKPESVKYHPGLPYYDSGQLIGSYPAMVAAIRNKSGMVESFHTTYLTQDGLKADVPASKKMMTPLNSVNGCAIRLAPVSEFVALTEGIESALSVIEMFTVPCWACVSSNGIETFEPPEGIKKIAIYADNDCSFAGLKSAYSAAQRLKRQGYEVEVLVIGDIGQDPNDVLIAQKAS